MGIFYARKLKFSVLLTQTIKLQPYARVASGPCPRWSWGSKGQAILCTLDTCPVCSKFFKSSYLNNLYIRKHSSLDYRYLGWPAFIS